MTHRWPLYLCWSSFFSFPGLFSKIEDVDSSFNAIFSLEANNWRKPIQEEPSLEDSGRIAKAQRNEKENAGARYY